MSQNETPQDDFKDNPLRRIRHAVQPNADESSKRFQRDKNKNFLLQRELAERLDCSEYCVQQSEKNKRFPQQGVTRVIAQRLYFKLFNEEFDDGGEKLSVGEGRINKAMK